jgi:hypothetical protein
VSVAKDDIRRGTKIFSGWWGLGVKFSLSSYVKCSLREEFFKKCHALPSEQNDKVLCPFEM